MEEKDLIAKIKQLSQISPNRDWVVLTKERILKDSNEEMVLVNNLNHKEKLSWLKMLFLKPAYTGILVFLVLIGVFGVAQNSTPGDYFYSVKKISERVSLFLSSEDKVKANLDIAEKRLEELNQIVEANQTKKLAAAIKEVQKSISEASDIYLDKNVENFKKIVKIDKGIENLESRGIVIDSEGSQKLVMNSLVIVLEDLINDLEKGTLNQKQEELLIKMKELVEQGNYTEALELYYSNQ